MHNCYANGTIDQFLTQNVLCTLGTGSMHLYMHWCIPSWQKDCTWGGCGKYVKAQVMRCFHDVYNAGRTRWRILLGHNMTVSVGLYTLNKILVKVGQGWSTLVKRFFHDCHKSDRWDCFLSGDKNRFAFWFQLRRLIFSVQAELACTDGGVANKQDSSLIMTTIVSQWAADIIRYMKTLSPRIWIHLK